MNIEELLGILFNDTDKSKIAGALEDISKASNEYKTTGLFPPPSILERVQRIAIRKNDDAIVLIAAVLKELRELRTIINEMRKESKCDSHK